MAKTNKVDKDTVLALREKASTKGFDSLTDEEQRILEYAPNLEETMVNSDDYSDVQIKNIEKSKEEGKKPSPEENAAMVGKAVDKTDNTLMRFVHGTNDVFRHHYNFKEDGVEFDIAIREPNIRERGLILARTSNYLDGMSSLVDISSYNIFSTLSLIRQCGVDIPLELQDDRTMYAPSMNWLLQIGSDFSDWEKRFRR